jgi:hypothetical protein
MRRAAPALLVLLVLVTAGPASASAAPVPSSLKALESSAEDLVDEALAGHRVGVITTATELSTLANGPAAASLLRAGAPPATVQRLRQRAAVVHRLAANGSFPRVALAANAVSGLMPGLYARFRARVPPSVLTLDYLDREAQLRSVVAERENVARAIVQLASTWARLRAKVFAAGGGAQAAAYDRHVATMKHVVEGSLKRVRDEAVHGLTLVDELEAVFTR